MPKKHRDFIDYVKSNINLKLIMSEINDPEINSLYNQCVDKISKFRKIHFKWVDVYIIKMIPTNNYLNGKGTGGTDLKEFLKKSVDETKS